MPCGFKNCGYIDTIKNKLCLKNDSQCPISYIKIRDVNSPPPDNITKLKEIKSEKLNFIIQMILILILLKFLIFKLLLKLQIMKYVHFQICITQI